MLSRGPPRRASRRRSCRGSRWRFLVQALGAWARRSRGCGTAQRWSSHVGHSAVSAFSRPGAPSTNSSSGVRIRARRDRRAARARPPRSPPMLLIASSIFWPSARTPSATSNEIGSPFVEPDTCGPFRRGSAGRSGSSASERGIQGVRVVLRLANAADDVLADRRGKHRVQRASARGGVGLR